jgi:UDP-3-O-[3-hydroxymyristoyl] glucosamine N-acyltransferase
MHGGGRAKRISFGKAKMSIRLEQLVERLGGQLKGDANIAVQGIAPWMPRFHHITFLSNPKFRASRPDTGGGTDPVRGGRRPGAAMPAPASSRAIPTPISPVRRSCSRLAELVPAAGIHASAVVDRGQVAPT